jgi:hypothetical protein
VCRSGRPEFKREVTRILDVIKECLRKSIIPSSYLCKCSQCLLICVPPEYKGEIDPLRGDEPNKQVRDAAKVGIRDNYLNRIA